MCVTEGFLSILYIKKNNLNWLWLQRKKLSPGSYPWPDRPIDQKTILPRTRISHKVSQKFQLIFGLWAVQSSANNIYKTKASEIIFSHHMYSLKSTDMYIFYNMKYTNWLYKWLIQLSNLWYTITIAVCWIQLDLIINSTEI